MTESNALEGVVDVALDVVAPLVAAVADEPSLIALLNQIGWSAPGIDLGELGQAVTVLVDLVENLRARMSFDSLEELAATLGSLVAVVEGLADFADKLASAAGAAAADPAAVLTAVEALAVDLLQYLSVLYVGRYPVFYAVLELLGLIDDQPVTALSTGGDAPLLARAPVERPALAFDAIGALLSDPLAQLKNRLGAQRLASQEVAEQVTRDLFEPILKLATVAGGTGIVGTGASEPPQPTADDIEARRRATLFISLPSFPVADETVSSELALVTDLVHAGGTSRTGDAGPGFLISPEGTMHLTTEFAASQFGVTISGGAFSVFFPADGPPVLHGGMDGVTIEVTFRKLPPARVPPCSLSAPTRRSSRWRASQPPYAAASAAQRRPNSISRWKPPSRRPGSCSCPARATASSPRCCPRTASGSSSTSASAGRTAAASTSPARPASRLISPCTSACSAFSPSMC